jgi:hypothetical protein
MSSGTGAGDPVKSKLWTWLRQVVAELVQLESRFGVYPADRSRVSIEGTTIYSARSVCFPRCRSSRL